ncbi:DUF222 domain-containing protein [Microbacterium sp.]|uniref:HNH endonuclease signature motif containing protein n=1 Tax=Microbacterium sp. TaxID=51671 RepID=UPI0039E36CB7
MSADAVFSPVSGWPVLDDLVIRLLAARAQVAAAQAAEAAVLAEAVDVIADRVALRRQEALAAGRMPRVSEADLPLREVALELGMAMRVGDRTVQSRISDAHQLVTAYPAAFAAFGVGRIDAGHAWGIVHAGAALNDEADRARYEELVLAVAETESPSRMLHAARAIAATICPDAFTDNATIAAEDRGIRLCDLADGMSRLIADLPAPLAHAIFDRLTTQAHAAAKTTNDDTTRSDAGNHGSDRDARDRTVFTTRPGRAANPKPGIDPRTINQLRADLLADLLLTGAPTAHGGTDGTLAGITGTIQITIPALTLAGDPTSEPALLAGYGPIHPHLARQLAGLAPGWDRVFTHPHTGLPLAVDRYKPSAQLKRYLAARDEHCRTPGCTRPAHRCDEDHTIPASIGGPTHPDNLANFCRRHHTAKHHTAWHVKQLGHGTLQWTSPTGRHYLDKPPATVRFTPELEPPF